MEPGTEQQEQSREARKKKRQRLKTRHEALKLERSSFLDQWRLIAEQMRPRGFRETRAEDNRADRAKQRAIINFTPIEAMRTLASGMMTGITSPSRPWFRLTVGNSELRELPAVKRWLSDVERELRELAARSNLYNGLHNVYLDLGTFAVTAMHLEPDAEDGVRCYVHVAGSYCLATGPRGNVDTMFRETSLTVAQLVELFREENCSKTVRRHYERGELDTRIDVTHAIYPNPSYVEGRLGVAGKKWCSDWWETSTADADGFLREAGYSIFPVLAPRWVRNGADVYGTGPGDDALGDCRALQQLERRAAQMADKMVSPPMSGPVAARGTPISLLPGEVNFVDGLGAGQALRPALVIDPRALEVVELKIRQHEERIRRACYAHLWLLITEQTGQMTATEVGQRREEKLQQLGAVLEGLNDELLDPLLDLLYDCALQAGLIPPPPEELQGANLKPEYISIMAAAQKLLATTGLERIAVFVLQLAAAKPEILDKIDFDALINEYADSLGVPPATLHADDAVKAIRAAREKLQVQAQQMAALQQGADAAKTLGETSLEGDKALGTMLRGVGAR